MEVRKATLASCNFMYYVSRMDGNLAVKQEHGTCVKNVAVENMIKAKFINEDVAKEAIDRVFNKCYKDLEPIGRRVGKRKELHLMKEERYLFGYK